MDEFMLLFRLNLSPEAQPSPETMQEYMRQYHDWVGGIAAQNKFVGGQGLSTEGRVLKAKGIVTDGPYVELKESIAGYIVVRARDFDEAVDLSRNCPMLNGEGNTVEVRRVAGVHEHQ